MTMSTIFRPLSARALCRAALAAVALAAVSACSSDRLLGPTEAAVAAPARPAPAVLASFGVIPKTALLRTTTLKKAISKSAKFTQEGGTLAIPELGVTLTVPPAAFAAKTLTITVTALAGNAVAYTFEPHGTQFLRPLSLSQDLATTTWATNRSFLLLGGGYFKDAAQVNTITGAALVDETLPVAVVGTRTFMSLWHFSGYMISMD